MKVHSKRLDEQVMVITSATSGIGLSTPNNGTSTRKQPHEHEKTAARCL